MVLIVEDQPLHAKLFRDTLNASGFRSVTSATGLEGGLMAARIRPDLILIDVILPDMDGRTLIATLSSDQGADTVPIMAISARQDREMEESCLAAGASSFTAKPVVLAALVREARRLVGVTA
ncbi:hypothetical protein ASG29_03990 [Sphingomonas sp. Leaf412]|nr:hypothetical protein ASG29_03990 [Sphingomonas sp. Leaf412]